MVEPVLSSSQIIALERAFSPRLEKNVSLARYTSLRVGGKADVLLRVGDVEQLVEAAVWLWEHDVPFYLLGSGTNVLISDRGMREVVILNQADQVQFADQPGKEKVTIRAASGAAMGLLARRAASRGWSGLEWASGIPGSVGGAVVGNAGAHGGDISTSMEVAEILHRLDTAAVRENWPAERFEYAYRSSILKKRAVDAVVLSATFSLELSTPGKVKARMKEFTERRKASQPGGASLGSMFKNPSGDYAGRLVDAAGLKGTRHGGAQISPVHGNFFINHGNASAADFKALVELARRTVLEKFNIALELEIELAGDWKGNTQNE